VVTNAVTFDNFMQSPQNLIQMQLTIMVTPPKKFLLRYFLPELLHAKKKYNQINNKKYFLYFISSSMRSVLSNDTYLLTLLAIVLEL